MITTETLGQLFFVDAATSAQVTTDLALDDIFVQNWSAKHATTGDLLLLVLLLHVSYL